MKLAIALSAVLSLASNAYAGCPKEWANPPRRAADRGVGPGTDGGRHRPDHSSLATLGVA